MNNLGNSNPMVVNCVFSGNRARLDGGAMQNAANSSPTIINSTFAGNSSDGDGGGIFNNFDGANNPALVNCIMWGNVDDADASSGGPFVDESAQIHTDSGTPVVNYSLIEGLTGALGGTGNIAGNPLFFDADGIDNVAGTSDDILSPQPGSPVIDAGDTTALPADIFDLDGDGDFAERLPLDLAGFPRLSDDLDTPDTGVPGSDVVDIGGFEFQGDCNLNGTPDACELDCGALGGACNFPGCGDGFDCNANGIPDECDIAACDLLAAGTPGDCSDVSGPNCDDCNLNGVPDCCDIDDLTSDDDNGDGIPDECSQFVADALDCPAAEVLWSCPGNWIVDAPEMDPYPDETLFTGPFHVVLDVTDNVFLDVPAEIESLIVRDAATLRVTDDPNASDLLVSGTEGILLESTLLVASDRAISVPSGPVIVAEGGLYEAGPPGPPGPFVLTALLQALELDIHGGACGDEGTVNLTGGMELDVGRFDMICDGDPDDVGCCPPAFLVADDAIVNVNDVNFVCPETDSEHASSVPMTVRGDVVNQLTDPQGFNFVNGGMRLDGVSGLVGGTTSFEVAGRDLGAEPFGFILNYALGSLEVTSTADVTFIDAFDNDRFGQTPCTEALYVRDLTLAAGSTMTLDGCRLYYVNGVDLSGTINTIGCGAAIEIAAEDLANSLADCDTDGDGIRDDNCTWLAVQDGVCVGTPIVYADMGGAFGACPVDGTADGNDRFHALNCFANTDPNGPGAYQCETNSPAAINVDAGGPFGSCPPDGVCDGNDAFAALNAFGGTSTCSCAPPLPGGPAPELPVIVQGANILLEASKTYIDTGDIVQVDVRLTNTLSDFRGYQLHVISHGGRSGQLELVDVTIEGRKDHAFAAHPFWQALNVNTQQMVAGLDTPGVPTVGRAYLATFVFRASRDADGEFFVALQHDLDDARHQTFLFPTAAHGRIDILDSTPARIVVDHRTRANGSHSAKTETR